MKKGSFVILLLLLLFPLYAQKEVINSHVSPEVKSWLNRELEKSSKTIPLPEGNLFQLNTLFYRQEVQRMYDLHFGGMTYELPDNRAGNLFRNMLAPFKGKYVLVDFWGIYCGPCVYGIRTMKEDRDRLKGDAEIEFLFITSLEETPEDRYNAFVEEQSLDYTFLLSTDDYRYMRELFRFNGIPRYILVGREGEILNDDFQGSLFIDRIRELTGRTDI